jgi:mycothiol synthase
MDMPGRIRPFQSTERDYEAVAGVAAQFPSDLLCDFEYQAAAALRAFDESFDGTAHALVRYVAEAGRATVGYAQLFHIPWLREPGRFWGAVRVDPAHQRGGTGGRLYQHLLAELRRMGAIALWSQVHESMPEIAARVERLGFRELFRSWPFFLDTGGLDLVPFQPAAERCATHGAAITTLAHERTYTRDWLARLYDLHATITRDIPLPGHPHPEPPLAWFERYVGDSPLALPEAFFIAKVGEHYVGESFMQRMEGAPGELSQKATGVRQEYRGAGIAVALKLRTIAFAQQHGYARIWTGVESNNPSMLAINQKLGFVQQPGLILFEKEIA